MSDRLSMSGLKKYAEEELAAHRYPNDRHTFRPASCDNCGVTAVSVTIIHHTGSEKGDFKGQIVTKCSNCGVEKNFLTYTGSHRKPESEITPACHCGNNSFLV